MKIKKSRWVTSITMFAAFAIPIGMAAQNSQDHHPKQHHYELVDLGTFGGPQSYFAPGSGYDFAGTSLLNSGGTAVGFADTSKSDPFPSFCFWDCDVVHAFQAGSDGRLTNLGALLRGVSSAPSWIAANGLVAGVSENGDTDPLYPGLPELRAVLWQDGKITDLGTLPEGGNQSEAMAVNSSGQVVGAALNTNNDANSMQPAVFWLWGGIQPVYQYQTRAFLWDQENGMRDLGTLPGGTDAQAVLVNEQGQVVGESYTSSAPGACAPTYALTTGAFIWDKENGMRDLGSLGGTCTLASALNNKGQVVGESYETGDQSAPAFIWENGKLQQLGGSLGGSFSGGEAINEAGEVAGFGYLAGNAAFHAAMWKQVGKITDLGVVGSDPCSYASAINARGQVVGSSMPSCDTDPINFRAVLWEDGSIFDLNTLIPPNSPIYLADIFAINDRGEMAGQGVDASGHQHAFLLFPCDENHPGIKGCDYSMVDLATAAQVHSAPVTESRPVSNENRRGLMMRRGYRNRDLGVGPQE